MFSFVFSDVYHCVGSSKFQLQLLSCEGTLTECYDELGNRYLLPYYVLSYPTNLLSDDEVQQLRERSSKHTHSHHRSKHKKHANSNSKLVCKACAQRNKQLSRPTSVQSQTGSSSALSPTPAELNQYTGQPTGSPSAADPNSPSSPLQAPLSLSPVNSIREIPESDSAQSGSDVRSSSASDVSSVEPCPHVQQQRQQQHVCQHCGAGVEARRAGLLRRFLHSSSRSAAPPADATCTCAKRETVALPAIQSLRIRISETNAELRVEVNTRDSVQSAKLQLQAQLARADAPGGAIAEERTRPELQRWLYCGRLLLDQQRIAHCKLQSDYVVLCSIRGLSPN